MVCVSNQNRLAVMMEQGKLLHAAELEILTLKGPG